MQGVVSPLQGADPGGLAMCGTTVHVPAAMPAQVKRNRRHRCNCCASWPSGPEHAELPKACSSVYMMQYDASCEPTCCHHDAGSHGSDPATARAGGRRPGRRDARCAVCDRAGHAGQPPGAACHRAGAGAAADAGAELDPWLGRQSWWVMCSLGLFNCSLPSLPALS